MWHETPVEIRYADTDQMGVVHHGVYPIYCELGRTDYLKHYGMPYPEMEAAGIYLMVAEMTCRFKAPARYGDVIAVRTCIQKLRPRVLIFGYEIINQCSEQLLYTGTSTHVFSDETRGARRCPEPFWTELDVLYKKHQRQAHRSSSSS